ncbi:MAG TPA: iron ABC transporter permease [Actinomycetota bacterium]|nr:iron ABC transporter permease [Actinomycetota bacterium]
MATATAEGRPSIFARLAPRELLRPQTLIILAVVLTVAYLAVVPLGYLLWGTFFDEGGFTLRFFGEAYSQIPLTELLGNSFTFAIGSTTISVVLGTTLAYLQARTDVPFKRLVFAASLVPLIIPGILHTVAWILLFSPEIGVLNAWLEPVFGPRAFNVYSMPGMIWVEGLHLSPLVFLLMSAAFRSMDPSLEESALMSGARMRTVIRRITLPLVVPALSAAILVMMVRVLEAFEVPAILGIRAREWVFVSRIYESLDDFPPKYGEGGALAMSLLLLTSVGVLIQSRLSRRGKAFQTVTGKGFRPRGLPLGRRRWPAAGLVFVYFLVAVVMPVLVLIYSSLLPFYAEPSAEQFSRFTLENYVATFTRPHTLNAFKNSLVLGIGSATAVMFFMAIASWLVVRTRLPGRWLVDNLAFSPLAIPGLVMGVALLFVYLRFPLPIYGTLWILFLAYCTRYMPYGMRYSSSSMVQISGELEESAQTSGASWWQTFRRVNLPLLMPGLIAGWIYIVLVSFRELSSSILLYSPGNEVLSIVIWERWENGQFTQLAALGMVMVATLVVLVVLATRLGARIGVKEH